MPRFRGDRACPTLPWEQLRVLDRERIDAHALPALEREDQSVCPASNFEHPRRRLERPDRGEPVPHAFGRRAHRLRDRIFMSADLRRLRNLVVQLPLERTPRMRTGPPTCRLVHATIVATTPSRSSG